MTGKPSFLEDYQSEHADPNAVSSTPFDFESIYRDMDGDTETVDLVRDGIKGVLQRLFDYWLQGSLNVHYVTQVGRRLIAFAQVYDPVRFGGISAVELSKKLGIPCAVSLQCRTGEVTREFGLANGASSHGGNRLSKEEFAVRKKERDRAYHEKYYQRRKAMKAQRESVTSNAGDHQEAMADNAITNETHNAPT
jgi:hypothetical protein